MLLTVVVKIDCAGPKKRRVMLNIYFRIVLQSTGFMTADTQVPGYLPYEKFYN